MEESAEEVIRRELGDDEGLLWAGRPRQGVTVGPEDLLNVLVGVASAAVGVRFLVAIATQGGPWPSLVIGGLLFSWCVVAGVYMAVGRLPWEARRRAMTAYGVTAERIVLVTGRRTRNVRSVLLDALTDLILVERLSGAGVIVFNTAAGHPWAAMVGRPGYERYFAHFDLAEDARAVYALVHDARRTARATLTAA